MLPIFLLALASLVPSLSALYTSKDAVVELTSLNFDSLVVKSPDVWFVEFYAPWCGHCKNLAPTYKKLANALGGIVKVGAVDCDDEKNRQICGQYGVQGFPTIKLFPGDKTGSKKLPLSYDYERSLKAMNSFAISHLTDRYVVKLEKTQSVESFLQDKPALKHVLLFTDKKTTTPLYKDRLKMAQVHKSHEDAVSAFGVQQFPSLYVRDPAETKPIRYDGELKYGKIEDFLEQYAAPSPYGKTNVKKKEKVKAKPRLPFDPLVPSIVHQRDLQKYCLDQTDGFSNLCVLSFLPLLEEEYPESVAQHQSLLSLLSSVKKHFYDKGESSDSKPMPQFHFAWLDGTTKVSKRFMNGFGVSTDLPSALVLSPGKQAYRRFVGAFEEPTLIKFLEEVGQGRGRIQRYEGELYYGDKEKADKESNPAKEASCGGSSKDDDPLDSSSAHGKGQCQSPTVDEGDSEGRSNADENVETSKEHDEL